MKYYKDFEKTFIGDSDVAALVLVGYSEKGLKAEILHFGEDGAYSAYITENAQIVEHYSLVSKFKRWLKVYDDAGLTLRIEADEIEIYRAGAFGCIINKTESSGKLV